jgi:hypothetical protein
MKKEEGEVDINLLVPFYLMSSFLYYKEDLSPLTDHKYDMLCKKLLKHWDDIEHQHKKYIDKEALSSGTGYYINWDELPSRIKGGAKHWYEVARSEMPSLNKFIKKGKSMNDGQQVFVLSCGDMDSIMASKIICKAIPGSIHLAASRKQIDVPNGSLIYLVRPYMGYRRICDLLHNYEVRLIDYDVSDEYKSKDLLESNGCKTTWVKTKENVLSEVVWDMFFNGKEKPEIIKHVRDYMKWEFQIENTLAIHYGYELIIPKFGSNSSVFGKLLDNDVDALNHLKAGGLEIKGYVDFVNSELLKELGFSATIDGRPVICANIAGVNSLFFNVDGTQIDSYDIAQTFYYVPANNMVHSAIYAISDDIDVGKLASDHFQGGGNRGAAGFNTRGLPFDKIEAETMGTTDYEGMIKASIKSSNIIQYVKSKIHGWPRNTFYGTWRGMSAVFYNTPFLIGTDFFEKMDTRGCDVRVTFCMLGNGHYRIACKGKDGFPLPDEFGKKVDAYSIETLPELVHATFTKGEIKKDMFFEKS